MTDNNPDDGSAGPPLHAGLADERFAVRVREERERQGKSQADIARLMRERGWSWHPQTVQRTEAGHRKASVGEAEALAGILHTTMDRLTWPGRAATAAALLDYAAVQAAAAWEQIASQTAVLLRSQDQLATAIAEAERDDYHGSPRIRELAATARRVLKMTPDGAVESGRTEHAHGQFLKGSR
jgi:transcriptional regulator with XRE-family HTH domain